MKPVCANNWHNDFLPCDQDKRNPNETRSILNSCKALISVICIADWPQSWIDIIPGQHAHLGMDHVYVGSPFLGEETRSGE